MSAPAIPVAEFPRPLARDGAFSPFAIVNTAMKGLASLKLTVALLVAGIFVVYVGTVAQQQADIWEVVHDYFHAWIMWVDVNLLFPRKFFPFVPHIALPAFPAPGGMTVGTLMAINLLAAHGWRFKAQAKGPRLALGIIVSAVGLMLGGMIISSGHSAIGFQAKPPFSWDVFWTVFLVTSAVLTTVAIVAYGYFGIWAVCRKSSIPWVEIILLALIGKALVALISLLSWGFLADPRPADEYLRIVWQLVQGGLAGVVLLVGCILVFQKRGGMVLLHLGIGLLMFNELWVAWNNRERQVFLQEGQTTNYVRDIRTVELALVDRSSDKTDDHVVVPWSVLMRNYADNVRKQNKTAVSDSIEQQLADIEKLKGLDETQKQERRKVLEMARELENKKVKPQDRQAAFISDSLLPVNVAVLNYYPNADVRDVKPGEQTLATAGRGLREALIELPAAKGTDTGSGVDMAGAYVRFTDEKNADLGTFMLSQLASEQASPERFAEKLKIGGKTYDVFLRFKREYMPYTLSLVDVRKDDYVASDTPRNYSSDIRINDPDAGVNQTMHIKMNDPLRYRGETFYQSGYHALPGGEATTLQVVHNRGWMIPYVACMVVVIGMIAHFLITVTRFVSRREAEEAAAGDVIVAQIVEPLVPAPRGKRRTQRTEHGFDWSLVGLPIFAAGVLLAWISYAVRPPSPQVKGFDLVRFGRLPVGHEGRIKPIDTLARNTLRAISLRETVKVDGGERLSATQWLLELISQTNRADTLRVIRIDNPDVLKLFKLEPRIDHLYSVEEIRPGTDDFLAQLAAMTKAEQEGKSSKESRTAFQRKLIELHERLQLYIMLTESFEVPPLPDMEKLQDRAAAEQFFVNLRNYLQRVEAELVRINAPRPVPVAIKPGQAAETAWQHYPSAWRNGLVAAAPDKFVDSFEKLKSAYHAGEAQAFNGELARYESLLADAAPPLYRGNKIRLETYFNYVSPFYVGITFYVLAFLLGVLGWLLQYRPLNWTAFTVLLLTFLFHTVALMLRIYISGRPPVTNLYSSAIFIGWAVVLAALVLELIFRLGLGNVAAAVAGFATLVISYFLSTGGDTITVLQAVLDTQFWLATHVVCITLGYSATYLAGIFGLLYVICGLGTPLLNERSRKDLGRMIYGITCFALLFSFYGTVLGGLWADDSWGRFWGWDPKENGALLIVLWNALIVHARWDKMVGDRGLAVLALGGNIVTSWSWFGVNLLGIGLHAYGGNNIGEMGAAEMSLLIFGVLMLGLIAAGCLPKEWWWSFRAEPSRGGLKTV